MAHIKVDTVGQAAVNNPEAKFEHPMAIAAAGGLTCEAKLAVLDRWVTDIAQRLEAAGEGMTPGPRSPDDAALLNEIEQARSAIAHTAQSNAAQAPAAAK